MENAIFITGTSTDIGKTYISALICKHMIAKNINVGYFKPVASGNIKDKNGNLIVGDVRFVKEFSGIKFDEKKMYSFAYERAYSPHLACKFEKNPPKMDKILKDIELIFNDSDFLVIEGSGGIVCPLRWDDEKIMQIDIVRLLGCEVLIVADAGLGGINSTILTIEYLRDQNIKIKGIVLNNFDESSDICNDNKIMIEQIGKVEILGIVKPKDTDMDINLSV
ncbi:dethiobiotin synthetase [Campylobacter pinnipediorum subsp. caledonicus]|uniref:ATP-dependent dethiobiotin synthetase BioD n=1 Tax=Campylobacter pinnipediorum subsp. caledonicus TaxID=1874362 RepID=A0A1S6U9V2_9BACT|nr:dethiobiotin synthase [Campylobacter pinnipediorum]AQW88237.1 dethiobiotin synthetase [Campylobacter pinnipediorum subsp. caledonicus]